MIATQASAGSVSRLAFTAPLFRALVAGRLRAQPGRALLALTAISLGVGLGVAVHLINASALNEFSLASHHLAGEADLVVRGPRWSGPEFQPFEIVEIRYKLHATQTQFAQMFGISVGTLRNWEQGARRPQGPARALLRIVQAHPDEVARVLWRYRRAWWMT